MFLPEILSLGNAFKQYFELVPALSDALRDEVYRIRHQVYCEELAYEPVHANRRESDEYDPYSLHLLIRSVPSREFIGCTRLIRTRPDDPLYPLPFEKTCAATLDRSIVDPARLPRHTIAEVSRLAVIAHYRQRKGESSHELGMTDRDFGSPAQPRFPYIPIALYLGTIELARLNGIDTLFVLTEKRLASHFGKLGVKIQFIGGPVEHRGQRFPSMMSANGIIDSLRFLFRPLYRAIATEVGQAYPPSPQAQ